MRVCCGLLGFVLMAGCGGGSGSGAGPDAGTPGRAAPKAETGGRDAGKDAAGDSRRAESDAGHDAPGVAGYPAAHPAMPQVTKGTGPVMTAPKFVIITFAGDALAASIDDFVDKVAASATYWKGTTAEYGVGPVASVSHISLSETPAASLADSDVQAWLTGKLSGPDAGTLDGGGPWPQPDGETLYQVYYPDTVTVTQGGQTSCNGFYGYHNDYSFTGTTFVTYSVVARCPPFPDTSAIDSVASIASHELIEAATDPLPQDNPAWASPDIADLAWAVPSGGEVGDLCASFGDVFYKAVDVPYLVQRTWSNKAAAAGHDPCQPDGAMPYFNAAAVVTEDVTIDTFTAKGINIPVGSTGTVTLDLYSDAPTSGPWTITATDFSSLFGGPQQLDITFGGQASFTGKNGDKAQLTVKALQQGMGGYEVMWISSTLGATTSVWLGVVGTN